MRTCSTCSRQFIDAQQICPLDDAKLGPSDELGDLAFLGTTAVKLGRTLGNYRVVGVLGEGGMGTVYIASHTRLDRYVAIKMLRADLVAKRDSAPRFFEEARTMNRIEHPNIVESIDVVEDPLHGAYSVLELLHGPDLKTVLHRGRIPLESAVHVGIQIADALAAVHAIDIVHRDLKPANMILIKRDGRTDFVKLIDFGVSTVGNDEPMTTTLGTAAYMAPEQAAGERVDGRADIYALGVLLFEMATGRHPFPSNTDDEFAMRHACDEPPRPSKLDVRIPAALDAIVLRCLAKAPSDRYALAGDVAADLRAVVLPSAPIEIAPVARSKARGIVAGAGVAIAAALAIVIATTRTTTPPAKVAPPLPMPIAVAPSVAAPIAPVEQSVTISFDSTPPGAEVFRDGETVPLGRTPFSTSIAKSDRPHHVSFTLAGHEVAELDVALDRSHSESIALEPKPAPRPTTTKPKAAVGHDDVIDPFKR